MKQKIWKESELVYAVLRAKAPPIIHESVELILWKYLYCQNQSEGSVQILWKVQ